MGPITRDMKNLTLTVYKNHKQVVLKVGTKIDPSLQQIIGATLFRMCTQNECGFLGQLRYESDEVKAFNPTPIEITALVEYYKPLFEEPKSLPPLRSHDHAIPLKPSATPFTIRPYRYAYVQKNKIEAIVKEMLEQGIIKPSISPFASLVLLVKKKYGTWRMCVD